MTLNVGIFNIAPMAIVVLTSASFPDPDRQGNVPAIAYARASLARKLIAGRTEAGWSQAELGRRAGIRAETISRIEHTRNTPDEKTFIRLTKALSKASVHI